MLCKVTFCQTINLAFERKAVLTLLSFLPWGLSLGSRPSLYFSLFFRIEVWKNVSSAF